MNIFRLLGRAFKSPAVQIIGTSVLTAFAPGFLPLIQISMRAIAAAEVRYPGEKTGADKAAFTSSIVAVLAPEIISEIERSTGKQLVDDDKFAEGMKLINDGLVACMNSFGILKQKPV